MGYPLGVPFIGRNKKTAENQRFSKFVSGERGFLNSLAEGEVLLSYSL